MKAGPSITVFAYSGMLAMSLCTLAPAAYAQTELPEAGCALEGTLRSTEGATSTEVTFVNLGARPIRTYWLNYEGKRVFYAVVAPGQSYAQQTYMTHPWVITNDRSGDCVALFLPARSRAKAVVR